MNQLEREARSKSVKPEQTNPTVENQEELPPILPRTNTNTTTKMRDRRRRNTSIKSVSKNYTESAKKIMQLDLDKIRNVAESIEREAVGVHTPMNKYKDPMQDGDKLLTNIKPVLKKEFPLLQLDLSKINNKYKAKDFHVIDSKTSRYSSKNKSISMNPGTVSTRSSVQPISIFDQNLLTEMNRNHTLKTMGLSPDAQVVDFGTAQKQKPPKVHRIYITEKPDNSAHNSANNSIERVIEVDPNMNIDEVLTARRRERAEKTSWSPRKAMELAKFKGAPIPKNLLPLLVRRKKLLKDVNKGGKHWEEIMKTPLEKPKKDEKFYLKYTPLSEYFKPSKAFQQNHENLTQRSRSRKNFWEVGHH